MHISAILRFTAFSALLVVPTLALPTVVQSQTASKTLAKPDAEFAEPYSSIVGVRELRDGRVVVSDNRDKVVHVIDFKSQQSSNVGREGSGPGEYGLPMQLFSLPGDTSVIFDPLNSRYLLVLPNGKPGTTFRVGDDAPAAVSPSAGGRMVRMGGGMSVGQPRAVDAQGRLYFEGSPLVFGPDGPEAADSAAIMRYDRASNRFDTLAYVQLPKDAAKVTSSGGASDRNVSVRIGGQAPFAMRDAWSVLPNGTIAIVRASDYHVDMVSATKQVTRGPSVRYTPVRVGEAEKAEYRESQKRSPGVGIMRTVEQGSGGSQSRTSATNVPPAAEPSAWPAVKPAFSSAMASPSGEVWVARYRAANDAIPRYDVFSSTGQLVRTVLLPKQTRVVGFGSQGTVYTVRMDDDDLQYLQRYRGS